MKIISLQSGSSGNCFYVEAGDVRLMFDAGITGQQAEMRLARHGRDIRDVEALFISHDHSDHARCMGVFHRKFGMPVYVTEKTLLAARRFQKLGVIDDVRNFRPGESRSFGDVVVHTVPTPHDSAEGVVFIVEHGEQRVGILTDLGHVFKGLRAVLQSLDAVIIESNYDPHMLATGPYPENLKKRITGRGGHISNDDSAKLLAEVVHENLFPRLKWACLCHLSQHNNEPEIARATHRKFLGDDFPIHVARRDGVSEIMEI